MSVNLMAFSFVALLNVERKKGRGKYIWRGRQYRYGQGTVKYKNLAYGKPNAADKLQRFPQTVEFPTAF